MVKIKDMYSKINKFAMFIKWIVPIVATIFSAVVYTPEYNGKTVGKAEIPGWKELFNHTIKLEPSVLLIIIVISALIALIALIIELITKNMIFLYNEIDQKQKSIDDLNIRIGTVISNSIKTDSKNKILEVMDIFMSNYSSIISIQLYEYIENKDGKMLKYEIKPTNYYHTRNGHVANLIHEQYNISEKLIKKYKNVKANYDNGNEDCILQYIKDLTEQLNKKAKNKNRITEDSLNKYSLLTLATQYYLNGVGFKNENLDETFVEELNQVKRTGFLRGILHGKYCKFVHCGDSYKGKRIYITKCLPIENKNHMFVMIFNPEIIEKDGLGDYLDELGEQFYKLLSERTKIVYNDIIKSAI